MATETKIVNLYDGTEEIIFYPNSHRYKKNGESLMSVTAALGIINKPALIYWAVNMACDYLKQVIEEVGHIGAGDIEQARRYHQQYKQEAADLGTQVHQWAEDYINGRNPELPEDDRALNGVTAFLQWVDEHNVQFVSSERLVYSRKYNFVGQMDAEAIIDGKLCVIDFKTSKKPKCQKCKTPCKHKTIYPEWLFQTAAYQKAAQEEGTRYNGHRRIIRFDKEDASFEVYTVRPLQADWRAFLGALEIAKRQKQL